MKLFLAALLALGSQLAVLPEPPGPIVKGPRGLVAAGDTITYTVSWGPGARASSYDVAWSVAASNGVWSITADSNGSGKWAPVPPAAPNGVGPLPTTANVTWTALKTWLSAMPWDSATFTVSVTSRNSFGVSAPVSATWRVARKPGVPGPIKVDSSLTVLGILIRPPTMRVAIGQSKVICAFPVFWGGAVGRPTAARGDCDSLAVALWTPASLAQQAHTDSMCFVWASSNPAVATITVPAPSCPIGLRPGLIWRIAQRGGAFVGEPGL